MKQIIFIFFSLYLFGCNQPNKKAIVPTIYKARIYQTEINAFGYDIYKDSLLIIHQPIIPGIQGNKGFATKEDALKVANLAIKKLSSTMLPPSITLSELDSLKIK